MKRNGETVVREYVEHDLDEVYGPDNEIVLAWPPHGLIERIDELLTAERARIREGVEKLRQNLETSGHPIRSMGYNSALDDILKLLT